MKACVSCLQFQILEFIVMYEIDFCLYICFHININKVNNFFFFSIQSMHKGCTQLCLTWKCWCVHLFNGGITHTSPES